VSGASPGPPGAHLKTATVSRGVAARTSPPVADRAEPPQGPWPSPLDLRSLGSPTEWLRPSSAPALSGVDQHLRGVVCAQGSVWCEPSTRRLGPRWASAFPLLAGPLGQKTQVHPTVEQRPLRVVFLLSPPGLVRRVRLLGFRRPSTASARELRSSDRSFATRPGSALALSQRLSGLCKRAFHGLVSCRNRSWTAFPRAFPSQESRAPSLGCMPPCGYPPACKTRPPRPCHRRFPPTPSPLVLALQPARRSAPTLLPTPPSGTRSPVFPADYELPFPSRSDPRFHAGRPTPFPFALGHGATLVARSAGFTRFAALILLRVRSARPGRPGRVGRCSIRVPFRDPLNTARSPR